MELGLPRSWQQPRPQHVPRARRGGPACPRPRPGGSKLQILLQATRSLLLTCDRLCIVPTPLPSRPARPDARASSSGSPAPSCHPRTGATLVFRPAEALHRPGQAAPPCAVHAPHGPRWTGTGLAAASASRGFSGASWARVLVRCTRAALRVCAWRHFAVFSMALHALRLPVS